MSLASKSLWVIVVVERDADFCAVCKIAYCDEAPAMASTAGKLFMAKKVRAFDILFLGVLLSRRVLYLATSRDIMSKLHLEDSAKNT